MTDEERQAVEHIKAWIKFEEINGAKLTEFKLVLNLIEKQQKEIEELKEENKKYIVQLTDEQYRKLVDIIRAEISKEWKDKIKAKIEEYEKALNILLQKYEWIEPSDTIIRNKFIHYIEFGQSLLEKE